MRALSTSGVLIAGLIALGCGKAVSPAAPVTEGPLASSLMPAGAAGASSWTEVLTLPAGIRLDPEALAAVEACVGEPVTFVGQDVLVVHRTDLPDGSRQLAIHGNPQGAVALGASSGTRYRFLASDTLAQVAAPSGSYVFTYTANIWVIGAQGSPRFGGPILLHLTVAATGEVTAEIELLANGFQCLS